VRLFIELEADEVVIEPVYASHGSTEVVNYSIEAPGVNIFLNPLEAARLDLVTRQATEHLRDE
jgi:hypothetical protein